jgi:hypothetical protein
MIDRPVQLCLPAPLRERLATRLGRLLGNFSLAFETARLIGFHHHNDIILISFLSWKDIAMILVAGGTKGGSGKTTIATTLAIMRTAAGRDVLLIDADDQETASDFTILRNEACPVAPAIRASSWREAPCAPKPSGWPANMTTWLSILA